MMPSWAGIWPTLEEVVRSQMRIEVSWPPDIRVLLMRNRELTVFVWDFRVVVSEVFRSRTQIWPERKPAQM